MLNNNQNLLAQAGYTLLEPSVVQPGPTATDQPTTFQAYLQGAYVTMFIVVITTAIVTLVYYGLGYMMSDVSSFKGNAKNRITKVFIGLAIALGSFVLLNEINPDLLKLDIIETLQSFRNS